MPFFIRKGNQVYREFDLIMGPKWSDITDKTTKIGVLAFTTRKDAQDCVRVLFPNEEVEVSNNLDYKL
ncbi:MAG: hypothetical protein CTY12_00790 [Methylotenera sp.]|nr:MAG: hypothetical protein CTY12_00790 [Methylotenera sp.]